MKNKVIITLLLSTMLLSACGKKDEQMIISEPTMTNDVVYDETAKVLDEIIYTEDTTSNTGDIDIKTAL